MSTCQPVKFDDSLPLYAEGQSKFFALQQDLRQTYGCAQAVLIGNTIKITGAVSLDERTAFLTKGDMNRQLKNIYTDLGRILHHFGCSYEDVVMENVYTTDMETFLKYADHRTAFYKANTPAGSWLEVKQLTRPESLVEIEVEAERK